jgi:hypothetical protein
MARGVSLHIGLNEVDPNHYKDGDGNPWKGELAACEADAHAMVDLATGQKFEVRGPLLSKQATSAAVIGEITKVAGELDPGDIFFLTYSGHGGQVTNLNPDDDPEEDDLDETWCLYDRELIDDELFGLLATFKPGVRVVLLSGCQDHQFSRDGRVNGAFTGALLKAWKEPSARKSLQALLSATAGGIPKDYDQTPNFTVIGFDIGSALSI